MYNCLRYLCLIAFVCLSCVVSAQPPERPGGPDGIRGPGGFGPPGFGPGGPREDKKLVDQFDEDDNGWLDRKEREKAREAAKADAGDRRGFGGRRGPRGRGNREPAKPGRKVTTDQVQHYPDAKLYEPTVLRTLFFEFENEDWEKELEDFHGTDVDVPAKLIVDGKTYNNVGMRFRGMSSYGMVPTGYKRSFNVSIDLADNDQRLYGYKTLNLLNSAGDPSFMSTVLYSHIAGQYIPVPKANHVHVVINGESWGVYVNVQQFNKDFLAEHFESTKGTRWKVSGSPRGDGGLKYVGDDVEEYKKRFEMKSKDGKKAWAALIELCRALNETPLDKLEAELSPMLDIDGTLRFLALDVALVNSDGYWTRASDYSLFLDGDKRFHIIPHDMNEAFADGRGGRGGRGGPPGFGPPPGFRPPEGFRPPGGFGPPPGDFRPGGFPPDRPNGGERRAGNRGRPGEDVRPDRNADDRRGGRGGFGRRGPGGPGHGSVELDPLVSVDNPRMPLRSRLLAVPKLRKQYQQYVREIAAKSLDWEEVQVVVARHAKLIEGEVRADTRKLDSLEAFQQATSLSAPSDGENQPSLRSFFERRRTFLLNYKEPMPGERRDAAAPVGGERRN